MPRCQGREKVACAPATGCRVAGIRNAYWEEIMDKFKILKAMATGLVLYGAMASTSYAADIVGLITKTEGNPFFVKMREGAQAKAKELGLDLRTFAGKFDGDNDSQVAAIEYLISAGA